MRNCVPMCGSVNSNRAGPAARAGDSTQSSSTTLSTIRVFMTSITGVDSASSPAWSLPQMRFRLQHAVAAGALSLAALTAWLAPPADAEEKKPASQEKYTEKISDSDVTFDMVPIPGGTFLMGSPKDE